MSNIKNKRLVKNTITLYFRTFVILLISLYISRLLLKELGIDDYGIYNVVGSVVVLFSFLNIAMTQSIQRFTTFELGKGDLVELKRVFSMSLITQIVSMLFIIACAETIGIWFLSNQLNIPSARLNSAIFAYHITILTFSFSMLKVPYEAMIISYEKMSTYAFLGIVDAILKLIVIIVTPIIGHDKLESYTVGLACETFLILILYIIYSIKKIEGCKFKVFWDRLLFKKILLFSSWSLFGGITNVTTQNGFIFLLNIFYGVLVNASMGIANQVSSAVSSFVGSFQTSFRPQIVKAYAEGDKDRVLLLIAKTSKISFLLVFIPSLLLIINMPLVLKIWLTDVPKYAIEFCRLIIISLIIDATTGPYNIAIMATGHIRNYQIAISISFIIDLIISFFLLNIGVMPQYILYSRIATRGLLNMLIGLYFLVKLLAFDIVMYLRYVLLPIIKGVALIIPAIILVQYIVDESHLLIWSLLVFLSLGAIISYYVVLDKSERSSLMLLIFKNKPSVV